MGRKLTEIFKTLVVGYYNHHTGFLDSKIELHSVSQSEKRPVDISIQGDEIELQVVVACPDNFPINLPTNK